MGSNLGNYLNFYRFHLLCLYVAGRPHPACLIDYLRACRPRAGSGDLLVVEREVQDSIRRVRWR